MKPISIIGIVLIFLGSLALIYQGISYTKKRTIIDIGPVHATAEKRETIPLPPVIGGTVIAGGVVLLLFASRKSKV